MSTLTYRTTYELTTCSECGVTSALPAWFKQSRLDDHKTFYCPNGHQQYFPGKSEAEKARDRATELERRLASRIEDVRVERERREAEQRRHAATKGQLTKARKRADRGVCQHCNRSFVNVARHVEHMHPDAVTP